jgi:hypothetical protein
MVGKGCIDQENPRRKPSATDVTRYMMNSFVDGPLWRNVWNSAWFVDAGLIGTSRDFWREGQVPPSSRRRPESPDGAALLQTCALFRCQNGLYLGLGFMRLS